MLFSFLSKFFRKNKKYSDMGYATNTSMDSLDKRDYIYQEQNLLLADKCLIRNLPPVRQQGILSSCASHAVIAAYEIQFKPNQFIEGSELFHYFNVRLGTLKTLDNVGMTIRQACEGLKRDGFALESLWPYSISKFNETPSWISYFMTRLYSVEKYERINSIKGIKESLMTDIPVIIGIRINDTFKKLDSKNYIYKPKTDEGTGHAVLIIGYDELTKRFICRNSWGESWGNKGNFEMSYKTYKDITFDTWRLLSSRRK